MSRVLRHVRRYFPRTCWHNHIENSLCQTFLSHHHHHHHLHLHLFIISLLAYFFALSCTDCLPRNLSELARFPRCLTIFIVIHWKAQSNTQGSSMLKLPPSHSTNVSVTAAAKSLVWDNVSGSAAPGRPFIGRRQCNGRWGIFQVSLDLMTTDGLTCALAYRNSFILPHPAFPCLLSKSPSIDMLMAHPPGPRSRLYGHHTTHPPYIKALPAHA